MCVCYSGLRLSSNPSEPTVLFVIGANGMGKTTTIGKIASEECLHVPSIYLSVQYHCDACMHVWLFDSVNVTLYVCMYVYRSIA